MRCSTPRYHAHRPGISGRLPDTLLVSAEHSTKARRAADLQLGAHVTAAQLVTAGATHTQLDGDTRVISHVVPAWVSSAGRGIADVEELLRISAGVRQLQVDA